MRRFVCAAIVVTFTFSVAVADEFFANVKKIEDGKVTFIKGAKKDVKGEEGTLPLAKDAKLVKGKYNKDTKSVAVGDPLQKEAITKMLEKAGAKGYLVQIVTDADNKKVTEIRFIGKKGGKKPKGGAE
ncbi:MAG: hypothetical protein L0Z62_41525 [Gemmataceae bacterium]|nr:hypothetical protein [Gemmataceae bacterium]